MTGTNVHHEAFFFVASLAAAAELLRRIAEVRRSPATLGVIVESAGYSGEFLVSAALAAFGSLLLVVRRDAVAAPVVHA
jgi:hypothetical protein